MDGHYAILILDGYSYYSALYEFQIAKAMLYRAKGQGIVE
jgi:hypothetical protein